jgi:hypothetical protein
MTTKHTPAPWCVQVISTKNHNTVVIDKPVVSHTIFRLVLEANGCNKSFQSDELDANLALIAAAPDLLDALIEAEKYLVDRHIETRGVIGRTVVLPKIRAAIAKATK